jgi:hypothetical protein
MLEQGRLGEIEAFDSIRLANKARMPEQSTKKREEMRRSTRAQIRPSKRRI